MTFLSVLSAQKANVGRPGYLVLSKLFKCDFFGWSLIVFVSYLTQNDKKEYVNVFMDHLVSWNAAMGRMARAECFVNLGEPKIPVA